MEKLFPCEYSVMPDRIVAGTFVIAAVMFDDGDIRVKGVDEHHLESFLMKLREMGVTYEMEKGLFRVTSELKDLQPVKVTTMPHPGFPTDLQSPMMAPMRSCKRKQRNKGNNI